MNSQWTIPLWSKKHTSMVFTCERDMRAFFFGRGEFCVFHCMLCRFVSGSYWKHHVSSSVMTLSNISALRNRSDEIWSHVFSGHVSRYEAPFLRNFFSFPNLPLQSVALFPYPYAILLLLISHLIFDLDLPSFVLCPHLHLSFASLASHFLGRLLIFSPFLEPPVPFKNARFLQSVFTISHCLIWLTFH